MIHYTQGNLLEADVEALVNTVNTVGVMGKGVALMFKEAYPENFHAYADACKQGDVQVGRMFVTEREALFGPRWIVNFPTKQHWRSRTKIEWIDAGLKDLVRFIQDKGIKSIAIPPLGCGNGSLDWAEVRPRIAQAFQALPDVDVHVYEPANEYQNARKSEGVEKLTPARALVAEAIRRYSIQGLDCSILEVQKLAWFLENSLLDLGLKDVLDLRFDANRYGPYTHRLTHLLNSLDGSYLICEKRLADAKPLDPIEFNFNKQSLVSDYLQQKEARDYIPALEHTEALVEGFQSPFGLELLATVDWLLRNEQCSADVEGVRAALKQWPGGQDAGQRKLTLFDDRVINLALDRLARERGSLLRIMQEAGI